MNDSSRIPTFRKKSPKIIVRKIAIDARLKLFEDRIASLLYKQAVEMDMAMSILLQSLNVSEEVLRQERAKSIAAVKRTNGQLRLEQKLRELESEAWQG